MAASPRYSYKQQFGLLLGLLAVSALLIWATPRMVHYIDTAEAAVRWARFDGGTELPRVYENGFHVIAPWNKLYVYPIDPQQESYSSNALTAEGLPIATHFTLHYRLIKERLPFLHQQVGPEYAQTWLLPDIASQLREYIGAENAAALCQADTRTFGRRLLNAVNAPTQQRSVADFVQISYIDIAPFTTSNHCSP